MAKETPRMDTSSFFFPSFLSFSRLYFLFFDDEEAEVLTRFSPPGPYISDGSMEGTPDTNVAENEESLFFPRGEREIWETRNADGGNSRLPASFCSPHCHWELLGFAFFLLLSSLFVLHVALYSFVKALLGRQSQDYMTDSRKEIFLKLER